MEGIERFCFKSVRVDRPTDGPNNRPNTREVIASKNQNVSKHLTYFFMKF